MPFIQFFPENAEKNLQASLTPKGILSFNAYTLSALGLENASHVFLFFDPERRAIGLRAADPASPGAVPLIRRKRVASGNVGPLLTFYRLVVTGKILLEPEKDEKENLIVLPLRGVRIRPGRRSTRSRALNTPRLSRQKVTQEAQVAPTGPTAAPRKRGRPRKTEKPAGQQTTKTRSKQGRARKATVAESASSPPRRRGRPPKTQNT